MNKKTINIMRNNIFLIIFFINIMLCACGGNESTEPKKDIIGKWQTKDKSQTLEFTVQGKVKSVYNAGNFKNETTSDLVYIDETHILGVWERGLDVWSVHIYGDKMTLKKEDGKKMKMSRID